MLTNLVAFRAILRRLPALASSCCRRCLFRVFRPLSLLSCPPPLCCLLAFLLFFLPSVGVCFCFPPRRSLPLRLLLVFRLSASLFVFLSISRLGLDTTPLRHPSRPQVIFTMLARLIADSEQGVYLHAVNYLSPQPCPVIMSPCALFTSRVSACLLSAGVPAESHVTPPLGSRPRFSPLLLPRTSALGYPALLAIIFVWASRRSEAVNCAASLSLRLFYTQECGTIDGLVPSMYTSYHPRFGAHPLCAARFRDHHFCMGRGAVPARELCLDGGTESSPRATSVPSHA